MVSTSLNLWLNYCLHLPSLIGFGDIYWVKRLGQGCISDYFDQERRFTTTRAYEDDTGVSTDRLKDSSWSTIGHLWLVLFPIFSKIGPH